MPNGENKPDNGNSTKDSGGKVIIPTAEVVKVAVAAAVGGAIGAAAASAMG